MNRRELNAITLAVRTCPPNLMTTLAAIIENADHRGRCRLSLKQIGKLSHQAENTVCGKIRRLEALDIIATTRRHDRRGQAPNLTTLKLRGQP